MIESNKDSEKVVIGWKLPKKLKKALQDLARKDEKPVQILTAEILAKYVQIHGSGNPIYSLEKYLDPNFKATPAFLENFKRAWVPYFQAQTDESLDEAIVQARYLLIYASAYRNMTIEDRAVMRFADFWGAKEKAGSVL